MFRAMSVSELGGRVADVARSPSVSAAWTPPSTASATGSTTDEYRQLRGVLGLMASFDAFRRADRHLGAVARRGRRRRRVGGPRAGRQRPAKRGRPMSLDTTPFGGRSRAGRMGARQRAQRRAGHPDRAGPVPIGDGRGFQSFTGRYGLPISHIDVRYVNGYPYGAVRIAGVPRVRPSAAAGGGPASAHPGPSRAAPSQPATRSPHCAARVWRDDLRGGSTSFDRRGSHRCARCRRSTRRRLDDDALARHLDACVSRAAPTGCASTSRSSARRPFPSGCTCCGRQSEDGRRSRRSPTCAARRPTRLPRRCPRWPRSPTRWRSDVGAEPSTLDDIRRASPAAAAALDAYLDEYGQRVVGSLRRHRAAPGRGARRRAAVDHRRRTTTRPRRRGAADDGRAIPSLEDARLAVASRDDHAGISCMWPLGLTRRALLDGGHATRTRPGSSTTRTTCSTARAELIALLRREAGAPSAWRVRRSGRVIGIASQSPSRHPCSARRTHHPPRACSPRACAGCRWPWARSSAPWRRRLSMARVATESASAARSTAGRAVVAADPEDAIDPPRARRRAGDHRRRRRRSTACSRSPAPSSPCTAGSMSHAGIAARELGIPAVLGVADALDRIPDGADVEVDPIAAPCGWRRPTSRSGPASAARSSMRARSAGRGPV